MSVKIQQNIRLGIFVLLGLLFLVLMLYLIGRNRSLFGATYILKARFENVQGLKSGNNVRYAGIDVGTVKSIAILSDTVLEVTLIVEDRMQQVIRKNAVVSIGTDGFVGNKIINISPAHFPADLAVENDLLPIKKSLDTDELLRSFNKTGADIGSLSTTIKLTFDKINNSQAVWSLLNDAQFTGSLKNAAQNINQASVNANALLEDIHSITGDLNSGRGNIGRLLKDSSLVTQLDTTFIKLKGVGVQAERLLLQLQDLTTGIDRDIKLAKGPLGSLLKDTVWTSKVKSSLSHIEQGSNKFNQVMDALKRSFLFRGYFNRLQKKNKSSSLTAQPVY